MPETVPEIAAAPRKRLIAYVDGFNLYFGTLRANPQWKWLNLPAFLEILRPDEELVAVRYFTAIVDESKHVSEVRDRQKVYLQALRTDKRVTVTTGEYQMRDADCRAQCLQTYKFPKEKKTDVAIAVALISDAMQQEVDSMVLISGDSDLEPAVEWIRKNRPNIGFTVYIPENPDKPSGRRNDSYRNMGVKVGPLPTTEIPQCQFPKVLKIGSGRWIGRPKEWK